MLPFATELNELRYYINQAITVQNSFAFRFNRALVNSTVYFFFRKIHLLCVVNDTKYINNKFTRALLLSYTGPSYCIFCNKNVQHYNSKNNV